MVPRRAGSTQLVAKSGCHCFGSHSINVGQRRCCASMPLPAAKPTNALALAHSPNNCPIEVLPVRFTHPLTPKANVLIIGASHSRPVRTTVKFSPILLRSLEMCAGVKCLSHSR